MSISDDERQKAIKLSLNTYRDNGETRTLSVEFRGELKSLPVIKISTSNLVFNHDNNRLSAQLDSHPKKNEVLNNPTRAESQSALEGLLKKTKDFKELMNQIKDIGQKEPGLINIDGLLINGNTRLAALRALAQEGFPAYMDVAVLPDDLGPQDVIDIEVNLQMRKLVHQDYTFTNQLRLIKKLESQGRSHRDIAKSLAWNRSGEKKVQQHLRFLKIIEEARDASNGTLPWEAFDNQFEVLKDLDKEHQNLLLNGDLENAEALKWSRLLTYFLGLNKDQVRVADENFLQEEMLDRRGKDAESLDVADYLNRFDVHQEDDLDDPFFDDDDSENNIGRYSKEIFKELMSTEENRDKNGNVKKDLEGIFGLMGAQLKIAARRKIESKSNLQEGQRPIDIIRKTEASLLELTADFRGIASNNNFNKEEFCDSLDRLKTVVEKLIKISS
ncbi:MAG: hypothetical protein P8N58_03515 [Emcibacteraceae bacterium]|nr:hypothetical protein [Emcibacteraceae bacterium]